MLKSSLYKVEIDNIVYSFEEIANKNNVAIVTADFSTFKEKRDTLEIPGIVTIGGVEYIVTEIKHDSLNLIRGFFKELIFPDSIENIPEYCFYGCTRLEKIVFGLGIKIIPDYFAFNSYNLKEVILGDNIEIISICAFSGNKKLKNIKFPNSLKEIQIKAFYNCTSLEKIVFPKSLEYLAMYSFTGCRSLCGNIYFQGPPPITDCYEIFPKHMNSKYNTIYVNSEYIEMFLIDPGWGRRSKVLIEEQKHLEIDFNESEVLLIPKLDKSSRNCYSGNIKIPKKVVNIKGELKDIDRIEDFAFSSCPELKSVLLPKGIKLGDNVFFNSPQCKIEYYDFLPSKKD